MAISHPNPCTSTFNTVFIDKRNVDPAAAQASLLLAMPTTLLDLLITNSAAGISVISSDLVEIPAPSWVSTLPPEVITYLVISIQEEATAATSTSPLFATSFSTSPYSFPSITPYSSSTNTGLSPYSYSAYTPQETAPSSHTLSQAAISSIISGSIILFLALGSGLLFICIIISRQRKRNQLDRERVQAMTQRQQQQQQQAAPVVVPAALLKTNFAQPQQPSMTMMGPPMTRPVSQLPVYASPYPQTVVVELQGSGVRAPVELQANSAQAIVELPGPDAATPRPQRRRWWSRE